MIEILIYLFEVVLKKDDKFILSKAHASFPLCILLNKKDLTKTYYILKLMRKTKFFVLPVALVMDFQFQQVWHWVTRY